MFDKLPALPKPLPTPQSLPVADKAPDVPNTLADVAELQLVQLPKRPSGEVIDWSAPLREAWDISESGALNIMEQFLSDGGSSHADNGKDDLRKQSPMRPCHLPEHVASLELASSLA